MPLLPGPLQRLSRARIEELQFTFGEGPCIEAYTTGRPVLVSDLADGATSRWPAYAPAVQDRGVRAVFAFPLQIGAARLGALDVFRARPGPLSRDELGQAFAFADLMVMTPNAHDHRWKGREAVMTTVSEQRLARIFVEVADTLVDEFDVIEFLQMLADRTAGLIAATTVGLLLADEQDRLRFMAASDETTKLLELFQLQWQDGPCLDAFRSGRPVVNADLSAATARWPRFAPYAAAAGFRSVHAFPLRLRSDVIGAMGVFGIRGTALDEADVQIVQALADVAAIGLLQERTIHRGEILTEQLQGALNTRIVIEQAKGAVAQAHHVSIDAAFDLLRAYARRSNSRLSDVASLVITDLSVLHSLTAD